MTAPVRNAMQNDSQQASTHVAVIALCESSPLNKRDSRSCPGRKLQCTSGAVQRACWEPHLARLQIVSEQMQHHVRPACINTSDSVDGAPGLCHFPDAVIHVRCRCNCARVLLQNPPDIQVDLIGNDAVHLRTGNKTRREAEHRIFGRMSRAELDKLRAK